MAGELYGATVHSRATGDRTWGNQPDTAAPTRSAGLDVAQQRVAELELRISELEAQAKVREGTVRGLLLRLDTLWIIQCTEDPGQTHDRYFEQLDAHMAKLGAEQDDSDPPEGE